MNPDVIDGERINDVNGNIYDYFIAGHVREGRCGRLAFVNP